MKTKRLINQEFFDKRLLEAKKHPDWLDRYYYALSDGFKYFFIFSYLGKIPILTNIFQIG